MNAIWSFWSKPHGAKEGCLWPSDLHFLCSLALSLERARQLFQTTVLVTDYKGAKLLIDTLSFNFDRIDTSLDQLKGYSPEWWAVGKLYAYSAQKNPFIHIDNDVYIWKALPAELTNAPVFAQNPEYFEMGRSWYYPEKFDEIRSMGGWVPMEVGWYKERSNRQKAVCCGFFGGNDLSFINYYAHQANKVITHPRNQQFWSKSGGDNILIEQYLLSACIEYHRQRADSRFRGIGIKYLFRSAGEAFTPEKSSAVGYTHLIGGAKRNRRLADALINRVRTEYPWIYEKCEAFCQQGTIPDSVR
jgi:hypothetical protein